jgi:hypothetical protein
MYCCTAAGTKILVISAPARARTLATMNESRGHFAGDKRTNAECLRSSLCLHKDWPQTIPLPLRAAIQLETAMLPPGSRAFSPPTPSER